MKSIKFLLVAILFVAGISANAQWTTSGTNTTTTNFAGINCTTPLAPILNFQVNGYAYVSQKLYSSGIIAYAPSQQFDFGWGALNGSHMEFYSKTNATRPGEVRFIFGDNNVGNISYWHYNGTGWDNFLKINYDGNVGIGTESPTSKLDVNGIITCTSVASNGEVSCTNISANGKITTKEVEVTLDAFPDYVFDEDYELRSLSEVEEFIKENKHLPGIPAAKEVLENGLSLGDMNVKLMEKVEELTLYIIQLQKEVDALK